MKHNRLLEEPSPYLKQHAYNPVDWFPWGDEAFEKARLEKKPLIISIGYSSCHWCHVMAHEVFEDHGSARLMNRHFVSIKVDREERPDVDSYYMTAVQMMSGQGGWPLTVFALPDGKPFYGGTYFPRSTWLQILPLVAEKYKNSSHELRESAESIGQGIRIHRSRLFQTEKMEFSIETLTAATEKMKKHLDPVMGGVKGAPKFPMPAVFIYLLTWGVMQKDRAALTLVETSLDHMAAGGIYDRVGGGFSRYSTDRDWKVPHFEKMLYDNAQLISLYAQAYQYFQKDSYRRVVEDSLTFVLEEMTSPEGVFYSALDADSSGREGLFYLWKKDDLKEILEKDYPLAEVWFGIGKEALWEDGYNILLDSQTSEDVLSPLNPDPGIPLDEKKKEILNTLKKARSLREPPGLDDKSLVSWNSLMIIALCNAYKSLGNPDYRTRAEMAARVILERVKRDRLFHTIREGQTYIDGYLEDYAFFIRALISLFEISGHTGYLDGAKKMTTYVCANFQADQKGFFYNLQEEKDQIPREMEITDSVIPSPNSVMAENLFLLSRLDGSEEYDRLFGLAMNKISPELKENPLYFSHWARLLLLDMRPFYEVVIVGKDAEEVSRKMQREFLPQCAMAFSISPRQGVSLFADRWQDGSTLIYICRNRSCGLPETSVSSALQKLS